MARCRPSEHRVETHRFFSLRGKFCTVAEGHEGAFDGVAQQRRNAEAMLMALVDTRQITAEELERIARRLAKGERSIHDDRGAPSTLDS